MVYLTLKESSCELPWVAAEKGVAPETGSALRPCVAPSALSHLWILEEFLSSTGIINWQFVTNCLNIVHIISHILSIVTCRLSPLFTGGFIKFPSLIKRPYYLGVNIFVFSKTDQ